MLILVNILLILVSLSYPFCWWLAQRQSAVDFQQVLYGLPYVMALLWTVKAILENGSRRGFNAVVSLCLFIIGISRSIEAMYWYPVMINAAMLLLFGGSLFTSQSLVERLARLTQPDLPNAGVRYTRTVTQVWCLFFIVNGTFTAHLILIGDLVFWAWYSGVLSYGLMCLLFGVEWSIRQFVLKRIKENNE